MDTNLGANQLDYAQTAHASGRDLISLINEVLDQAKIESGRLSSSIYLLICVLFLIMFYLFSQANLMKKGLSWLFMFLIKFQSCRWRPWTAATNNHKSSWKLNQGVFSLVSFLVL